LFGYGGLVEIGSSISPRFTDFCDFLSQSGQIFIIQDFWSIFSCPSLTFS
jgi:hypothetical protein